jgi:hypothetical protein
MYADGGGKMGLGGDGCRCPWEGTVIVPIGGGRKELVEGGGVVLDEEGRM